MTDLSAIPDDELRAELHKRDEERVAVEREAIRKAFPCPICGGDPRLIDRKIIREERTAPKDSEGRPMLYAPYKLGDVVLEVWETRLICENGHETFREEMRLVDPPRKTHFG